MQRPEVKGFEQRWNDYRDRAIPIDAAPVQRLETEKAFFAGALSMYEFITCDLVLDRTTGEPTDGDVARMESLGSELLARLASFLSGEGRDA